MEPVAGDEEKRAKIAQLLDAALPEFANAGLDGARVDAIARAAGMNKRLLYHYVGDKEALFEACLDLAFDRVLESPDGLQGEEWRLICHGCASGRTGRLVEIAKRYGSIDGNLAAMGLGLRLLAGLLPDLADRLLGNEVGDDAGRRQAIGRVLRSRRTPVPKPRLKLRPDLRKGG